MVESTDEADNLTRIKEGGRLIKVKPYNRLKASPESNKTPVSVRVCAHDPSHSGLLEPRGSSTVRKEPGVLDKATLSVMP